MNIGSADMQVGAGAALGGQVRLATPAEQAKAAHEAQRQAVEQQKQAITGGKSPDEHARVLAAAFNEMRTVHPFKPGDLVMYKPGCQNTAIPYADYPCVIKEVLAEPLLFTNVESGNTNYGRKYDLVILAYFNGKVMPFMAQSELLMPYIMPGA